MQLGPARPSQVGSRRVAEQHSDGSGGGRSMLRKRAGWLASPQKSWDLVGFNGT